MKEPEFLKRLRKIDGYLCAEPNNQWSVCDINGDAENNRFTAVEDNPVYALIEAEKQNSKYEIDRMSQYEMAKEYRFALPGASYFDVPEIGKYFMDRFKELGGFTPEISKELGWE